MWKVMKACVSRCWGITWHCLPFPFFSIFYFPLLYPQFFFHVRFRFSFNSIYVICISKIDLVVPWLMLPLPLSLLFHFLLMLMPLNFKAASTFFFSFLSDGISLPLPCYRKKIGEMNFSFFFLFWTRRRKISILKKINFLFPSSLSCYCSLCFQKKKRKMNEYREWEAECRQC